MLQILFDKVQENHGKRIKYWLPAFSVFPTMFNTLPNNKILDWSTLEAFAVDKINVTQILKFVFRIVEYIVGKEENAGHQHFLLFPQCFQKLTF